MNPFLRWTRPLLAGCLLLALAACSTVAVDYDQSATFDQRHDYAFLRLEQDPPYTSLDAARIEKAVVRGLSARGYRQVPEDQARVLVRYRIEPETWHQASGVSFGFGFGSGRTGVGVVTPTPVKEITEGKLVLEMVRPEDRQTIWRGISQRTLTETMTPERREALIDSIIEEMLAKYPPSR